MVETLLAWRHRIVLLILAITLLIAPMTAEKYGDRLQIILPLTALGCSILTGGAPELLVRFGVMEVGLHGTRAILGDAPINQRPTGGGHGFPSGHTTAATFGASALVHECLRSSPVTQAAVAVAAAFTGTSRLDAGKHTIWQVLAGWIWGYTVERAFRKSRPKRAFSLAKAGWKRIANRGYRP